MARAGISYDEVEKLSLELQARGETPTVDKLRLLLGTGSRTTLHNHLKQWREHNQRGSSTQLAGLPELLVSQVQGLYKILVEHADERAQQSILQIDAEKQALQAEVETLNTSSEQLTSQLTLLTENYNDTVEQFKLCQTDLKTQQDQTAEQGKLAHDLALKLDNKLEHNKVLENQIGRLQDNLSHYRQQMAALRQEELQNHERAVHQLNERLLKSEQHAQQLGIRNESLKADLHALRAQHDYQARDNQELKARVDEQIQALSLAHERSETASRQHALLQSDFDKLSQSLTLAESRAQEHQLESVRLKEHTRHLVLSIENYRADIGHLQAQYQPLLQENHELKVTLEQLHSKEASNL